MDILGYRVGHQDLRKKEEILTGDDDAQNIVKACFYTAIIVDNK